MAIYFVGGMPIIGGSEPAEPTINARDYDAAAKTADEYKALGLTANEYDTNAGTVIRSK